MEADIRFLANVLNKDPLWRSMGLKLTRVFEVFSGVRESLHHLSLDLLRRKRDRLSESSFSWAHWNLDVRRGVRCGVENDRHSCSRMRDLDDSEGAVGLRRLSDACEEVSPLVGVELLRNYGVPGALYVRLKSQSHKDRKPRKGFYGYSRDIVLAETFRRSTKIFMI